MVILFATTSTRLNAQGTLVHYWHFNNYAMSQHTDTIHGIPADFSLLDTATAKILYTELPGTSAAFSTYIDSTTPKATDYDTVNLQMGAPAGYAIRARNRSDSMQLLFYIPTTGYKNILLAYASQSSSTTHGQLHQMFDYSVDSGMTWRTSGLSQPSDSAWLVYHRTTVSFTTDTEVNNNNKLVFRIQFNGNDTFASSGNNRFDNVTIMGDTMHVDTVVTPPAAVKAVVGGTNVSYSIFPNPTPNNVVLSANVAVAKTIQIYDDAGRVFGNYVSDKKDLSLNTANFPSGNYHVQIIETATGRVTSLTFARL